MGEIEELTKKDLITMAIPLAPAQKVHSLDKLFQEAGIKVLRLPPYHPELNPIELQWAFCKPFVERNRLYSTKGYYQGLITSVNAFYDLQSAVYMLHNVGPNVYIQKQCKSL